eukprot:287434_1
MATFHRASQKPEPEYPIKPPFNAESATGSTTSKLSNPKSLSKHTDQDKSSSIPITKLTAVPPPSYVTQTQLLSLIRTAYRTAASEYGENLVAIKKCMLDKVGGYLLDLDIADKRIDHVFALLANNQTVSGPKKKYFSNANLFGNIKSAEAMEEQAERIVDNTYDDMKSICSNMQSLHKAKEIDLKTGYPIVSWCIDMYCRDRIANSFNINATSNRRYDIKRWFNDNLFMRYVSHAHPDIAHILQQGMMTISKYVLPPLLLQNIQYRIADKLNGFALYVVAAHRFIESIVNDEWQPIWPIHIDIKIIPRHVELCRRSASLESHLRNQLLYIPQLDFFSERCTRMGVDDLAKQFKRMWTDKTNGKDASHRRYLFVIDRRCAKDTIYLIFPRAQPWPIICDYYYHTLGYIGNSVILMYIIDRADSNLIATVSNPKSIVTHITKDNALIGVLTPYD